MNQKGMTLVEMIIAIVVIGIAFYALISVFINVAPRNVDVEDQTRATHLALEKIEEISVKGYNGAIAVPAHSFSGDFSKFNYRIIVDEVTSAEPDTVAPAPPASPPFFRRVKVQTWGGRSGVLEVVTLVTTYEKL